MEKSRIILDTNSYLRLAYHIHPLLGSDKKYGNDNFCLYIIKKLRDELNKVSRFKYRKFGWIQDKKHKENRRNIIDKLPETLTKNDINEIKTILIDDVKELIDNGYYNNRKGDPPSYIDIECLAYSIVLDLYVVTDDDNLIDLGNRSNANTMTTLELLKHMLDNNHPDINMKKIKEIVCDWDSINDKPRDLKKDYKKIFGERFPDCWDRQNKA